MENAIFSVGVGTIVGIPLEFRILGKGSVFNGVVILDEVLKS